MKVLVTGAGNLARVVVPALAAAGHTLRLLDFRPIDTAHDLLQGDLRNPDDLAHGRGRRRRRARRRCRWHPSRPLVAAGLLGDQRGGTFNLYQAAVAPKLVI
jgi:nucleoside-diphosphate-sugar epimerase